MPQFRSMSFYGVKNTPSKKNLFIIIILQYLQYQQIKHNSGNPIVQEFLPFEAQAKATIVALFQLNPVVSMLRH